MIIGITGTDGAGKSENSPVDCSQDLASSFVSVAKQTSDRVHCACKAPVPDHMKGVNFLLTI